MSAAVAIAVVSWNTRELLRACLDSLAPALNAGLAEAWVVDNASADRSAEMVRSDYPQVQLLELEQNIGFGPAVNEVARRSSSEWIAAANADIRLEPEALETLLATGRAAREVGAVAPRLLAPDGSTQHSVHPFPSISLALAFNLGLHRVVPGLGDRLCLEGWWDPERPRTVSWAHGAFLLMRREAFEEIGGFDADQWLYAEDIDIQWRLRAAGWRVRYEPAARVQHEIGAATSQAFGETRAARHVAATYAWLARRRGITVTWLWAATSTLGAAMRAALLALPARLAPHRFGVARAQALLHSRLHARGLRRRATLIAAAPAPGGPPPRPVDSGADARH